MKPADKDKIQKRADKDPPSLLFTRLLLENSFLLPVEVYTIAQVGKYAQLISYFHTAATGIEV